jgi:H+-translocating NAD(P) transhydrogenase subunit alpha
MVIGLLKETFPGELRVALIPDTVARLVRSGIEVIMEAGAGAASGFSDSAYEEKGARLVQNRSEVLRSSDLLVQVRGLGANETGYRSDLGQLRGDQTLIGLLDPLDAPQAVKEAADKGLTAFSMELIPRISRAQVMDVLSSMATVAGYKAVLLAAEKLPRMFPMLMTAAGVVHPARVFVIGAGVAGLQAIATARRLGAAVQAYDVRPSVKEEIQSLGAKFVELPLDTAQTEGAGGYAKSMDEQFYQRQKELMGRVVAESDVVITTAQVIGKKPPVLVTREMVSKMAPGSVIVDLAAERGGNCELTQSGQVVTVNGVSIIGPVNLPASIPYHASQMYAKNIHNFLSHLIKEGKLVINLDDEITRETLVARGGEVTHPRLREMLGLKPVEATEKREP